MVNFLETFEKWRYCLINIPVLRTPFWWDIKLVTHVQLRSRWPLLILRLQGQRSNEECLLNIFTFSWKGFVFFFYFAILLAWMFLKLFLVYCIVMESLVFIEGRPWNQAVWCFISAYCGIWIFEGGGAYFCLVLLK